MKKVDITMKNKMVSQNEFYQSVFPSLVLL